MCKLINLSCTFGNYRSIFLKILSLVSFLSVISSRPTNGAEINEKTVENPEFPVLTIIQTRGSSSCLPAGCKNPESGESALDALLFNFPETARTAVSEQENLDFSTTDSGSNSFDFGSGTSEFESSDLSSFGLDGLQGLDFGSNSESDLNSLFGPSASSSKETNSKNKDCDQSKNLYNVVNVTTTTGQILPEGVLEVGVQNGSFLPEGQEKRPIGILANCGDRVVIKCSASYVTRWVSSILPGKETRYMESRRFSIDPLLTSQERSQRISNEFSLEVEPGSSGSIRCQSTLNSSLAVEIYIFSQSGPKLVGHGETRTIDTVDNILIPCVANYPNVNAQLLYSEKVGDEISRPIESDRLLGNYDPRIGFHVKVTESLHESYKCVTSDDLNEDVIFTFNKIVKSDKNTSDGYFLETGKLFEETLAENDEDNVLDINCVSKKTLLSKIMKMIRCKSPYECEWLSVCFDKCWQNADTEKQEARGSKKRLTFQNPYPRGMVTCYSWSETSPEFLPIFKFYFTGLDKLSYFLSDGNIPKNALIQLETLKHSLYTNQPATFQCEIATFILVSNIKFAASFKNGTKILLEKIDPEGDELILDYEDRGFSRKEITLLLTKEMTEIICMAPWYNSTEWIQTAIQVKVKDVVPPEIDRSTHGGENGGNVTRIFYKEDRNQYLHCTARGEPKPEITWQFPSPEINLPYPDNNEGESILTFPKVDERFNGRYVCISTNPYGTDSLNFWIQVQERETGLGSGAIGGISVAGIGFLALVIAMIFLAFKYNEAKDQIRDLTEDEINEFNLGNPDAAKSDGAFNVQNMAFDPVYVISEVDLIIAKNAILGSGEYGMVYRGFLNGDAVAVKSTKPNPDVTYFKALLGEIKIMAYIGRHENVVEFRGAVVERIRERIAYAVVELSPLGNLHSYLRKVSSEFLNLVTHNEISTKGMNYTNVNPTVTTFNLIHWCVQIARGMDHLVRKKVIHGDLAARNVLVFRNDVVKITDFGLSRQLYGYSNYVKKQKAPLPWRWMAEESLRFMEFSSQSDVWSFGITCWEIFSFGQIPYPGYDWTLDFVEKLSRGLRLAIPNNAPKFIYNEILKCWLPNPIDRPSFADLADFLEMAMHDLAIKLKCDKTISHHIEYRKLSEHVDSFDLEKTVNIDEPLIIQGNKGNKYESGPENFLPTPTPKPKARTKEKYIAVDESLYGNLSVV